MKVKISMKQILAVAVLLNLLVMLQSIPVIANPVSPIVYLDDLPSQATYTVKTDGVNYWAVRYDGYIAFESTNASYVINSARNGLGSLATGAPGTISVQKGTYTLSKDIIIGKLTHLIAESGTVLSVSANLDLGAIVIDSSSVAYTDWKIENFRIDLNSYKGNGIYSSSASRTDMKNKEAIYNVYILDVASNYAGFNLTNIFVFDFRQIRITGAGTGAYFGLDNTLIAGNGVIDNMIVGMSADNSKGIVFDNSATKYYAYMTLNRLQVGGGNDGYDGTVGLQMNGVRWSTLISPDLEGRTTALYLKNSQNNVIENLYVTTNKTSGDTIALNGTSYQNRFVGGYIQAGTGQQVYNDTTTGTRYDKNVLEGTILRENAGGWSFKNTRCDKVSIYNATIGDYRTTFYGTTNTAKSDEWFSHNLIWTPTRIKITVRTGVYDGVPVVAYDQNRNATHWQIGLSWVNGTEISADAISVEWTASIYEY